MFKNRKHAGIELGNALEKYEGMNPIILAIPRGGIVVGYYAALHLRCDFDVIIVRKLGFPEQPEAAFGAIAEDGSLYIDPLSNKFLSKDIIEKVEQKEKKEILRRIQKYRKGKKLQDLKNRVVIIVDDGIASGATIFAAIKMCRKKQPEKLVVAAPVSGVSKLSKLEAVTDEVVILEKRKNFFAVSEGYLDFSNLSDTEVIHYMNEWYDKVSNRA